jgi:hypothetical protein
MSIDTNKPTEYIGQLEGEVAVKADENSVLRTENQQLREENNRLTDLTRMLLSSNAFSGFLQELSQSGVPAQPQHPSAPTNMQDRPQQQSQQHQRKDVNPLDAARQMTHQQPQIGMALMPETNVDLNSFQSWNSGLNANDFQVFAVTELPAEPTLDLSKLSEKPIHSCQVTKSDSSKTQPSLPEMLESVVCRREAKADSPADPVTAPASPFTSARSTKSTLTCSVSRHSVTPSQSLEALCAQLEETYDRLGALLPRE